MPDINTVVVTPTVSVVAVNSSVPGSFGQVAEYLARVNVEEYGAVADGTTDCTTAFQDAITAAGGVRTVFIPPSLTGGKYRITGTVTFNGPVDGSGATLLIDGGVVVLGSTLSGGGNAVRGKHMVLPTIQNVTTDMTAWGTGAVGVNISNLLESQVYIPHVVGFDKGVQVTGVGTGSVFNVITLGRIQNNKNGLYLTNGSGWANQNTFVGGQFQEDSSFGAVSGCYHIHIEDTAPSTFGVPNGNTFIGHGMEGEVVEHALFCQGLGNQFFNCRFEGATPTLVFDGAEGIRNIVYGGYDSDLVTVTNSNGATRNALFGNNRVVQTFSGTGESVNLWSATTSNPVLKVYPSTADPFANGSDWTLSEGADRVQYKASGDAAARIFILSALGRMYFSDGAQTATNGPYLAWSTGNHLRMAAGNGFGLPQHTSAEEAAFSGLVDGLMYYNTDLDKIRVRANGAWETVTSA